jgi:uncharacterized protein (DUF1778 family)
MRERSSQERLQSVAADKAGTDINTFVLYGALALIAAILLGTLSFRPF